MNTDPGLSQALSPRHTYPQHAQAIFSMEKQLTHLEKKDLSFWQGCGGTSL